MQGDSSVVELALQVDGYESHYMAGTWLLVVSTGRRMWEREVWLNGQLYRFSYDGTVGAEPGRFLAVYIPELEWTGARARGASPEVVRAAIREALGR